MAQIQRRFLIPQKITKLAAVALLLSTQLSARKFYDDDPLPREPKPRSVGKPKPREVSETFEFLEGTLSQPGERQRPGKLIRSQAINTLGEVPDSGWYQNRHGSKPMTMDELLRGPGNSKGPAMAGKFKVTRAKLEGVTPGFTVEDSNGRKYLLKLDPPSNPEMASAADVIGCKFFYALGYSVPENYIVHFSREQLVISPRAGFVDARGIRRRLAESDIDEVLATSPRNAQGQYRAMASLYIPGDLIGPFRYEGVRNDDPNDIVPHEHRRDLRGLFVFAAWLNHTDAKAINTLDSVIEEDGVRYIKHHLIDFGAILGSDSFEAKSPRAGYEYFIDAKPAAIQLATLGLYIQHWARIRYPEIPSVGRFESSRFDPEKWKPNYAVSVFDNRLPDDTFWAAKKVMAFNNEQIRAIVKTGEYSDPKAVDWITDNLITRRDKIGRTYFSKVLPLDNFQAKGGQLQFDDLGVKYNFTAPQKYAIHWSRFDNQTEQKTPLPGETSFNLPGDLQSAGDGKYFVADIRGDNPNKTVTVYLRKRCQQIEVVGIERTWETAP